MAKMVITVVIESDKNTLDRVKAKITKAAHKVMVSCSCMTDADTDRKPKEQAPDWFNKLLEESTK